MKIIITESQLMRMMDEAAPLSPKEIEKRLKKAKELAVNFKNPRQFALKHWKLWNFLRAQNLVDEVFPKRKLYKPDGYWTAETIADDSRKYNSRSEFLRGNQIAYMKALELGIMDDIFPEIKRTGRRPIYDVKTAIETAKNFEGTRTDFFRQHPTPFRLLKDNNLLSKYFPEDGRASKITDEDLINKAKEYDSIVDLVNNNKQLYIFLKNRSLLDKIYPEPLKIQKLLDRTKKYDNKYDLRIKDPNLYKKLVHYGLWEKVFPKTSLSDLANDLDNPVKED